MKTVTGCILYHTNKNITNEKKTRDINLFNAIPWHTLRHFEDIIHSWLGSAAEEETEDYNDHRANDVYLTAMMFLSTSGGRLKTPQTAISA